MVSVSEKLYQEEEKTYVDESRMRWPPIEYTPINLPTPSPPFLPSRHPEQLIETTPRRRATILWVLRERDRPLHPICPHLVQARLSQRIRISKGDVCLVRRSRGVELIKEGAHGFSLNPSPAENGGSAADRGVLRLDLGGPTLGNKGGEDRLHGERDEVVVVEEAGEEAMDFWDRGGTTHIHHNDRCRWFGRPKRGVSEGGQCSLPGSPRGRSEA